VGKLRPSHTHLSNMVMRCMDSPEKHETMLDAMRLIANKLSDENSDECPTNNPPIVSASSRNGNPELSRRKANKLEIGVS
jgi:hypothetical protein